LSLNNGTREKYGKQSHGSVFNKFRINLYCYYIDIMLSKTSYIYWSILHFKQFQSQESMYNYLWYDLPQWIVLISPAIPARQFITNIYIINIVATISILISLSIPRVNSNLKLLSFDFYTYIGTVYGTIYELFKWK
jgi:hypothetical protein